MAGCEKEREEINHSRTFCVHYLQSKKSKKKDVFLFFIFFFVFKEVNGYPIDNNTTIKERKTNHLTIEKIKLWSIQIQ